jgi:polyisoprenoid-binding protein YceI
MAWEIDQAHSLVEFAVKHMMVTTVKGRFTKFTGTLELDEAKPENSRVDVTIDVASIFTGDENRDNHLRSPDFFDVAQYPVATFKSTKVEKIGEDRYRVTGDLTLHGVTREVALEVDFEGQGTNPYGKRVAGFSVKGAINRKDFGLNWNVALETGGVLVSDKVTLSIEAQAVQTATVAA